MTWVKRGLLLFGASGSLFAALFVLLMAGLPQRAAFTGQIAAGQLFSAPEINALAPPFALTSLNGEGIRLADLRGQQVIVNFWATWCGPCRVEMPILQRLYDDAPPGTLSILAVNLGEPPDAAREWQRSFNLTYDILLDEGQMVAALYQLRGQPSTYVISPDGIVTHIFYGAASENALRAALQS